MQVIALAAPPSSVELGAVYNVSEATMSRALAG
jgi:hypothetical protein